MRKKCKRKIRPQSNALLVYNRTILMARRDEISEDDCRDIVLPAFLALEDLRTGHLPADKFITLNEFNCMTWALGRQAAKNGVSRETGDIALEAKKISEDAAEALAVIGERFNERERFIATGDELNAVRLSILLCEQLVHAMPTGLVLQAMREAEELVKSAAATGRRHAAMAA